MGITDLFDCSWISSGVSAGIAVTSVSTENVVGVLGVSAVIPGLIPEMIPGLDFLVAELSGIEIVLESLKDCVGAVDMAEPLISLNSSCVLLFKLDLMAFLEELLHSLGSVVSEML